MVERIAYLTDEEIAILKADEMDMRMPEQIEAIYRHGNNILVSASAGSGKTFVMTNRIVDMIKRHVTLDELFISTFTVKAAEELKTRLETMLLDEVAKTDDEKEKQFLLEQIGLIPNAPIGTMDSFAKTLVDQYGYRIGVSPNFRILQDGQPEYTIIKKEVFDEVFTKYYEKGDPIFNRLVRQFSQYERGNQSFRRGVEAIYNVMNTTPNPKAWLEKDFLIAEFEVDIPAEDEAFNEEVSKELKSFGEWLKLHIEQTIPQEKMGGKVMTTCFGFMDEIKALGDAPSPEQMMALLQAIVSTRTSVAFRNDDRWINPLFNDPMKERKEILKGLLNDYAYRDFARAVGQGPKDYVLMMRQFLMDYQNRFMARKKDENSYEFTDIAHFAIQILEDIDEVRQAFQEQFEEVMVDEYQDNNRIQEKMLDLLSNQKNRFMVGDIKQSIYRFRQADPNIFNQKYDRYSAHPEEGQLIVLKANFRSRDEVLTATNDFFRHFMDKPVGEIEYDNNHMLVPGKDKEQKQAIGKEFGRIPIEERQEDGSYQTTDQVVDLGEAMDLTTEVLIFNKETKLSNEIDIAPEIKLLVQQIIQLENQHRRLEAAYDRAAETLKNDLIAAGRDPLSQRLESIKPFKFSDVAILVRSRDRYDEIIQAFEHFGIPLTTDGGQKKYLQSLEVMTMLDTLRTIANPRQDYPLVALMKSAMFNFTEDELARIALQGRQHKKDEEQSVSKVELAFYDKVQLALGRQIKTAHPLQNDMLDLIQESPELVEKLQTFDQVLTKWRRLSKTISLYDLIWVIYRDRYYYDWVGLQKNGRQRQANLYALALKANQFEDNGFKGLNRFIEMINRLLENDSDLEEVRFEVPHDAVNIMTIHKSKGLEFDVVYVIDIHKNLVSNKRKDNNQVALTTRELGLSFNYLQDFKKDHQIETVFPKYEVKVPTYGFMKNVRLNTAADFAEFMRLLYVAMTRAVKKLVLIGVAEQSKLEAKVIPESRETFLPEGDRRKMNSFLDWLYHVKLAFRYLDGAEPGVAYDVKWIDMEKLSDDAIGQVMGRQEELMIENQSHNRLPEQASQIIDRLDSVDRFNHYYHSATQLASVMTPSQVKKRYEGIELEEGVDRPREAMVSTDKVKESLFALPDFSTKGKVSPMEVGSAVHELMQRLPLSDELNLAQMKETLKLVNASPEVKKAIQLERIEAFFASEFGQFILEHRAQVHREKPFAMLYHHDQFEDDFVVRGIVDGYLVLDDQIILFDYKTDYYKQPQDMVQKYRHQMNLYAQALARAYQVKDVQAKLILLGTKNPVQVVDVPIDQL